MRCLVLVMCRMFEISVLLLRESHLFDSNGIFVALCIPSIAAWLSVFIITLESQGVVSRAVYMAASSALVDDGHKCSWQQNVSFGSVVVHPQPIIFSPDTGSSASEPSVKYVKDLFPELSNDKKLERRLLEVSDVPAALYMSASSIVGGRMMVVSGALSSIECISVSGFVLTVGELVKYDVLAGSLASLVLVVELTYGVT